MDKISRIIPTNHRISSSLDGNTNADIGRIGSNGRSESVMGRNVLRSSKSAALEAHRQLTGWRAKEARQSEMVEKVQNEFFSRPPAAPALDFKNNEEIFTEGSRVASPIETEEMTYDQELDDYISEVMQEAEAFKMDSAAEEDYSSYPKGSFLDVQV